jgi:hypothetical protein
MPFNKANLERFTAFWVRLARDVERTDDAVRLENAHLPMLEVNAVHALEPTNSTVLVLPEGQRPAGYRLEGELALFKPQVTTDETVWVEQVPWSRAEALACVWCESVGALAWRTEVSTEFARALQSQPDLLAFLALEGDTATGMMLASSDGFAGVTAGSDRALRALLARGAQDFERFTVSLEATRASTLDGVVLATLEVWISH